MDSWKLSLEKDFTCKDAIFIEGLPGIGNVGKIAVDYLIEKLEAKKVGTLFSRTLPNSVFVNEDNLVQLPAIEVFHIKKEEQDFLFLSGDTQPSDEVASYCLSEAIIDFLKSHATREIVTTGGIGLEELPEELTVFITGNNADFIATFKDVDPEIYNVVGPIVGVSGLLLGLARDIPAAALLVETFAHPMYVGLKEARELVTRLSTHYALDVDVSELDEEIALLDEEEESGKKGKYAKPVAFAKDVNYIG